jgi:vibriolysin
VINEVDYQNPTLDTMEFVEIVNPGTAPYVLDDVALVLMNGAAGTNREYARFKLSGSLGPGQYMVVSSPTVVVPPGTKTLFFLGPENQIQNAGDAGDAVALFDLVQHQLIDALSYGGSVLGAEIDNEGSFDFVEGTPTPVIDPGDGSMRRVPNGNDTNNAEADWQLSLTPTPGATNTP